MPASYSTGGTREPYFSSPYDSGMNSTGLLPPGPSASYPNSLDSSPLSDNQYTLDDGGFNPEVARTVPAEVSTRTLLYPPLCP
jgi:hypothetical protein